MTSQAHAFFLVAPLPFYYVRTVLLHESSTFSCHKIFGKLLQPPFPPVSPVDPALVFLHVRLLQRFSTGNFCSQTDRAPSFLSIFLLLILLLLGIPSLLLVHIPDLVCLPVSPNRSCSCHLCTEGLLSVGYTCQCLPTPLPSSVHFHPTNDIAPVLPLHPTHSATPQSTIRPQALLPR